MEKTTPESAQSQAQTVKADDQPKGIDDALAAGAPVQIILAEDASQFIDSVCDAARKANPTPEEQKLVDAHKQSIDAVERVGKSGPENLTDDAIDALATLKIGSVGVFSKHRSALVAAGVKASALDDAIKAKLSERGATKRHNRDAAPRLAADGEEPPTRAQIFLHERGFHSSAGQTLRYWRDKFFEWKGTQYHRRAGYEIDALVSRFLTPHPETGMVGRTARDNLIADIKGYCALDSKLEPPAWIDRKSNREFIAAKNGLVNVEAAIDDPHDALLQHSPMYFSLGALPYDFDPGATCERWLKILAELLPAEDDRQFVQEWFGYNLVRDVSQHKMVIFHGNGGNGKSVVLLLLRLMLGDENVAAVPLEALDPTRTFPLAKLTGKLANIVEEIGALDKVAEGILKQLVSGSPIQVEEKFGAPYTMISTAKLSFATNSLPRFADRSNGIWRRIIVVPFTQTFEAATDDKNLITPEFWIDSGELPGILNWAIAGLASLRARRAFAEPSSSKDAKARYRTDCNPAADFLRENVEQQVGCRLCATNLYKWYAAWCRDHGYYPLNAANFAPEVIRAFPCAERQNNPTSSLNGGARTRKWLNIAAIDSGPGPDTRGTAENESHLLKEREGG